MRTASKPRRRATSGRKSRHRSSAPWLLPGRTGSGTPSAAATPSTPPATMISVRGCPHRVRDRDRCRVSSRTTSTGRAPSHRRTRCLHPRYGPGRPTTRPSIARSTDVGHRPRRRQLAGGTPCSCARKTPAATRARSSSWSRERDRSRQAPLPAGPCDARRTAVACSEDQGRGVRRVPPRVGAGPKSHRHALMPDLLIVVRVPPLLIVSTLLLAQVERRVTASRRLPAPPRPVLGWRARRRRRRNWTATGCLAPPAVLMPKPDQIEATAGPPSGCREPVPSPRPVGRVD